MEHFAFIFTIFFMLLGPIKIIPTFVALTRNADLSFKRALAVRASLIACTLVLFVALVGGTLLERYRISLNALRVAGGLVLVIAALNTIFRRSQAAHANRDAIPLQLAASPLAIPAIVPPAGVAAILIFVMLAPDYPGTYLAIGIALTIMMILNFLVMYYIDLVMKTPGLMLVLQVVGATLIFMQVCIGVEIILRALKDLGLVTLRSSA
jgi:multiple antibiotic resistance protein